jgi:hypothetical protein
MAFRLYNPKRVPCPVSLRDGTSTSVPGKGTLVLDARQVGSADIIRKRKKGLLILKQVSEVAKPEVATKPDAGAKGKEGAPEVKEAKKPVPKPVASKPEVSVSATAAVALSTAPKPADPPKEETPSAEVVGESDSSSSSSSRRRSRS